MTKHEFWMTILGQTTTVEAVKVNDLAGKSAPELRSFLEGVVLEATAQGGDFSGALVDGWIELIVDELIEAQSEVAL